MEASFNMSNSFQRTFQHLLTASNLHIILSASCSSINFLTTSVNTSLQPSCYKLRQIVFLNSVRGKPKLLHDGYTYVYHKERKETYIRLFRQVKSWVDVGNRQWIFETFLSDYEQGAFNAMLEVFSGTGKEGCFFHLCKRLSSEGSCPVCQSTDRMTPSSYG